MYKYTCEATKCALVYYVDKFTAVIYMYMYMCTHLGLYMYNVQSLFGSYLYTCRDLMFDAVSYTLYSSLLQQNDPIRSELGMNLQRCAQVRKGTCTQCPIGTARALHC